MRIAVIGAGVLGSLYAAKLAGISTICMVGGIQAIAALTYGTKQIPRADKIFGPGNQYVTAAKQYALQMGVAIDLPAGQIGRAHV